jgi:hypothetical protein
MTRFTVVWPQESLDELAEIWLEAVDRTSIATAAREIEEALTRDPLGLGSHIAEGCTD